MAATGQSSRQFATSDNTRLISYMTDVEGDAAYWKRFVEHSRVLTHIPSRDPLFPYDHCADFLHNTGMLVYGGDVWDKGGSDLYVIRQLLYLQQRYPDRVEFVLGNRDLNKMRILQEVGLQDDELPHHGGVYWLLATGRPGDPGAAKSTVPSSAVERLKWMLAKTMGSPSAFELRREELQREQPYSQQITDQEVVESYRASCHPMRGEMGQFLTRGKLALRLGQVIFFHGALPLTSEVVKRAASNDDNIWDDLSFAMPWRDEDDDSPAHPVSIDEWLDELNKFQQDKIRDWKESIASQEERKASPEVWSTQGGYHSLKPGLSYCPLLQYGMGWTPDMNRNPTVVYSSVFDNGMPRRFYAHDQESQSLVQLTQEFFRKADIRLMVLGHQPVGDSPCAIRVDPTSMIVCGDASYSADTMWYKDDSSQESEESEEERANVGGRKAGLGGFRGDVAVSEILIEQCTETGKVLDATCHGVLSDGTKYESTSLLDTNEIGQLASGQLLPNLSKDSEVPKDWWVKFRLQDGSYLVSTGEGYKVWNCIIKPADE